MRLVESGGLCSSCMNHVDGRLVDHDVAFDGAPVLDRETNTIAISPWDGLPMQHDDLLMCEACAKEQSELLEIKPDLHARQFREIERLTIENNGLRDMILRLRKENDELTQAKIGPRVQPVRGPGRPRKQPVGA